MIYIIDIFVPTLIPNEQHVSGNIYVSGYKLVVRDTGVNAVLGLLNACCEVLTIPVQCAL